MRSAHDEHRAREILSGHRPVRIRGLGRVCGACDQSWPCTDYQWAVQPTDQPERWTWRDLARTSALIVALGIVVPLLTYRLLPVAAWAVLAVLMPVVILVVIVATSRRSP